MSEKREFPRLAIKLKIAYEFINWNDYNSSSLKKPKFTTTFDISARGLGLSDMPELKTRMLKKLKQGKKKIKVGIYLDNDSPPLVILARLVWTNYDPKNDNEPIKCGLNLIDITDTEFEKLKIFISSHIKSTG